MSRFGTITGKNQLLGYGIPQPFPITLDPVVYEGALIYADNDKVYFSDGVAWKEFLSDSGVTQSAILPFAFMRVDGTTPTGTSITAANWVVGQTSKTPFSLLCCAYHRHSHSTEPKPAPETAY